MADKKVDPTLVKRHWHLLAFDIPMAGFFGRSSMYVYSKKRLLSMPEVQLARHERNVPQGATLISISYLGMGNQHELAGTSPVKEPSTTSPAYHEGLRAALVDGAPNPYPADAFEHQEWWLGNGAGKAALTPLPLDADELMQ